MYQYGADFYGFLASFALASARKVVPLVGAALPVRSVVDFGCGHCAWLRVWQDSGAAVAGVDGPYVETGDVLIDPGCFRAADLAAPIDLGRRFDLVQSLEVAEHLPAAAAGNFVDMLVAHGPVVLFSAAVPGQGGENHVNERPPEYWRGLFHARGYVPIDYLRPLIVGDPEVAPWYRYNMLLYAAEGLVAALPEALRSRLVPETEALRDYRPLPCRLRQALVRQLPPAAVNRIARLRSSGLRSSRV
ncbi:MAG: hypothetical protein JO267_06150 [Alphaproteobacteria bacterium]|nr:hypothetical protein [Alphaproteobacteria bacterium]